MICVPELTDPLGVRVADGQRAAAGRCHSDLLRPGRLACAGEAQVCGQRFVGLVHPEHQPGGR